MGIGLHDYRTQSEPLLSFKLEDLHDGVTKTKYRYYMVPTNAKLVSDIARQDNTKLTKFNQNSWPLKNQKCL